METIPELVLINRVSSLGKLIEFTELAIEDIDRFIQQEDLYEIRLSVYRKGNPDGNNLVPDSITRADLIPVLKIARDRYADKLKQQQGELKEIILKLRK